LGRNRFHGASFGGLRWRPGIPEQPPKTLWFISLTWWVCSGLRTRLGQWLAAIAVPRPPLVGPLHVRVGGHDHLPMGKLTNAVDDRLIQSAKRTNAVPFIPFVRANLLTITTGFKFFSNTGLRIQVHHDVRVNLTAASLIYSILLRQAHGGKQGQTPRTLCLTLH